MIQCICPHCRRCIIAPEEDAGEMIACPACRKTFLFPRLSRSPTCPPPSKLRTPVAAPATLGQFAAARLGLGALVLGCICLPLSFMSNPLLLIVLILAGLGAALGIAALAVACRTPSARKWLPIAGLIVSLAAVGIASIQIRAGHADGPPVGANRQRPRKRPLKPHTQAADTPGGRREKSE